MSQSESTEEAGCPGIAIVGGGCSGLLVAVQLLKLRYRGRITIIEPRSKLGRGLAYSTQFDEHLLNVPAGKMSAMPDAPDHFLRWLKTHGFAGATAATFAPRRVYGEYLEDVLNAEMRARDCRNFRHICAEVLDIGADGGGAHLTLSDQSMLRAERVVLALGNPASCQHPDLSTQCLDDRWQSSPWIGDALRVRFAGERILLLVMGLTAVDSVMALQSQATPCQTYMISRRGIPPQVHNLRLPTSMPPIFGEYGNLRLMFRELRAQIGVMREQDLCWRVAIDSLRPVSNDMWRGLSVGDQKRFLRHLKTYW
ncbi:MAG: FAD/NAD(P)-binding protein, partial [Bryobacteraceae bacterium]